MSQGVLSLRCVGISHITAPLALRERIALSEEESAEAVRRICAASAEEALVLSTCNRTEFYTQGGEFADPKALLREVLMHLKGVDVDSLDGALYDRGLPESLRHLFRVACGLDSMVLGETQILGQVRDAGLLAQRAGGSGVVLGKLLEVVLGTAKRARSETAIGAGAVSVASAGVELARKVYGTLAGRRVLIVGAGQIARLVAEHLRDAGVHAFTVANRDPRNGRRLADDFGGTAVPLDRIAAEIARADLVVAATSSPEPLVRWAEVRDAVRRRGGRQVVFIDLAVPRDVEPRVNEIPNVFVHDLDTLRTIVDANLERRRGEVPRVETFVEEGIDRFLRWHRSLEVVPTVTAFRDRIEAIRIGEIDKFRHRFRPEDLPHVEAITRSIVGKILHAPTTRLRESADEPLGPARLDAVRHLFELDEAAAAREGDAERAPDAGGPGGSEGGDAAPSRDPR